MSRGQEAGQGIEKGDDALAQTPATGASSRVSSEVRWVSCLSNLRLFFHGLSGSQHYLNWRLGSSFGKCLTSVMLMSWTVTAQSRQALAHRAQVRLPGQSSCV